MLVIFALIMAAMIIAWLFWRDSCKESSAHFFFPLGITLAIILVILTFAWGHSYKTYVDQRTFFDGTREQYASAVTTYKNHAEIDIKSAAWTDLKYQGYQENVADFIKSLRNRIIRYNDVIISKRIMGKNLFTGWLIVEPDDDMVIIKMSNSTE